MGSAAATHGKETVIVGLGSTGLSCAKYLASKGEPFTVVDSRENPPALAELKRLYPFAAVELGAFREATLAAAGRLIVSPGVDPRQPVIRKCIENGVKITGDVNLFAGQASSPIVAVTGSNAKSTVVSMLGEMARETGANAAVAGNIGIPVLDILSEEGRDFYVLELSSFQLETTTGLGAEVACVLNMSADHMDRYPSMQDYHRAKHRIFQGCRQAVVNRDDPLSEPLLPPSVKRWSFGMSRPDIGQFGVAGSRQNEALFYGRERLMAAHELKMPGRHNVSNALAAFALGAAMGLGFEPMARSLKRFTGLPHRCQWVAERRGVAYYNDSKGTNVGAAVAAMEGLSDQGRIILLAGGRGKGADFSPLAAALGRHGKLAVLFGEDAPVISRAVEKHVAVIHAATLPEAVEIAHEKARPGDVVLLSPACASFDMFVDYRHRGEAFVRAVKELPAS